MDLITELKRRNVFRVAVAYAVIAWVAARPIELPLQDWQDYLRPKSERRKPV